jgi:hypothetical protein
MEVIMSIPKFDPRELEVIAEVPGYPGAPPFRIFNTPLSQHDHGVKAFSRSPWWQMIQMVDTQMFSPSVIPDNIARAFCIEGGDARTLKDRSVNSDMFGLEWEYEANVGGSIVRPGNPFLEGIEQWYDKVIWPDIDTWDWKSSLELNSNFLSPDRFNQMWFQTGWFERLIAFLDFENAVIAIFDEDSQEHVHKFFDKLTDLYIRIFDKATNTYPEIHSFFIHDDWGSQQAPFFSPAVVEKMIVPYMKRVTDFLHSKGLFCELHSCGNIIQMVPNIIAAGWDAWAPQLMNDIAKIYEMYGDKILVGTLPQGLPPVEQFYMLPVEVQQRFAHEYANTFCREDKPSYFNCYAAYYMTPAFRDEMYMRSRINYAMRENI